MNVVKIDLKKSTNLEELDLDRSKQKNKIYITNPNINRRSFDNDNRKGFIQIRVIYDDQLCIKYKYK